MTLRDYIHDLEDNRQLVQVNRAASKFFEIAGILKKLEPTPVRFSNVVENHSHVVGNLFCNKASFANYLGITVGQIIPTLLNAIDHPTPCELVKNAPCQEVVINQPDLDILPILRHCDLDGGNYISSGIFIAKHPIYGTNVDFHRCMQFSKTEMAVRVVRRRHFDTFLRDRKAIDVAICIGNPPNILAAAATSVAIGVNELEIANTISPVRSVKALLSDILIPADSEFVLEGIVYLDRLHDEGPFVDLTGTYDIIRQEPVFVVKTITHRADAVWHALLPGGLEHKLLMGMPREPTIFKKVNQVVRCLDVHISPGGCSWLHAIIQIQKQTEDDGKKAILAAFAGHSSLKHVTIVDDDIDIYNPQDVEWAMATRFQGDQGMLIKDREPGSSLDPSSDAGTHLTTKMGFDLTKPLVTKGKSFNRAAFPSVDLDHFMKP
jgi:2,5-furandicarboxylate decarboxylase 1